VADSIPTLPCIRCDRPLEPALEDAENQPYGGTEFVSYGHYGSSYDPMDGTAIVINICDSCLYARSKENAVLERRQQQVEVHHSYNFFQLD